MHQGVSSMMAFLLIQRPPLFPSSPSFMVAALPPPSSYLSVRLFALYLCLPAFLSFCMYICLSICLPVRLSVCYFILVLLTSSTPFPLVSSCAPIPSFLPKALFPRRPLAFLQSPPSRRPPSPSPADSSSSRQVRPAAGLPICSSESCARSEALSGWREKVQFGVRRSLGWTLRRCRIRFQQRINLVIS